MPTRFLNNININDSYTMPAADGTADQVISTDGAGQLSFIDQTTLSAESAEVVKVPVKNLQGAALTKGDPVYISGSVGASGRLEVKLADAGDATKMPALGLLAQDLAINGEGYAVVTGKLRNLTTSPIDGTTTSGGEVIYVKSGGTTGSALTTVKPTGVNFIQNVGKVGRASTSNDGTIVVSSILRSNDVPTPLYIDHDNQRVGIDEQTPAEKLVVSETRTGSTPTDLYTTVVKSVQSAGATPNPGTGGLKVQYNDGTNDYGFGLVAGTTSSDFLTSGPMHFYTNSDLDTKSATGFAMVIDTSQRLGIGTTSPDGKLNIVAGDNGTAILLEAEDGANVWKNIKFKTYVSESQAANFSDGSHIYTTSPGGATEWPFTEYGALVIQGRDNTNGGIALRTGGGSGQATRIAIREGGDVGIGTTSPGAKIDVEGNAVIGAAGNTVSGDFAVAINKNTVVTSEDGFAQGENTIATGRQAAAFGFNTYANGPASIAGGSLSETNAQRSIAVGATAITNAEDSAAFNTGTRANGLFSFATGQGCFATNNAAFATGSNTQATGLYSFSGGVNSIASGNGAVALGGGAQCSGEFSFAAGNINVASGINSTALGFDNDAIGAHSTVIGHLNTTSAAAAYGVAINFQNTVSGQGAFAFNQGNTVSGLNAASGGVSNTVTAEASFAYGFGNDTSGGGSTPPQQILFGRFLKPPRDASGNAGEAQVIVGRHNKHANQPATAFAVGTGTATNATANSFTVQYDGNVLMEQVLNKNYSSDSAAASGGVPIGGIYHDAGDLKIRRT